MEFNPDEFTRSPLIHFCSVDIEHRLRHPALLNVEPPKSPALREQATIGKSHTALERHDPGALSPPGLVWPGSYKPSVLQLPEIRADFEVTADLGGEFGLDLTC